MAKLNKINPRLDIDFMNEEIKNFLIKRSIFIKFQHDIIFRLYIYNKLLFIFILVKIIFLDTINYE